MELARELVAPIEPPDSWPLTASLQAVVAELAGALATEQIAEAVAEAGISGLGAQVAVVAVRTNGDRHFRAVHATGLSPVARDKVASVAAEGRGFIARVGRSREALFLPSVAKVRAAAWHDSPALLAGGALVGLPICRDGRGIGVVVFGWPHSRAFSDDDRGFLAALRGLCTLAMDRLCLYAERDRLRSLVGRARSEAHPPVTDLDVGDLHIDLVGHRIAIGDRTITLTPTELALLVFLADEPGRARSRREILQHLWHTEHVGDERVCDAHVSNLRHKIERDPAHPERIVTKRGIGYALQVR